MDLKGISCQIFAESAIQKAHRRHTDFLTIYRLASLSRTISIAAESGGKYYNAAVLYNPSILFLLIFNHDSRRNSIFYTSCFESLHRSIRSNHGDL